MFRLNDQFHIADYEKLDLGIPALIDSFVDALKTCFDASKLAFLW